MGPVQGVAFKPISTRFLRVLMTSSTGSAYSIAEIFAYRGHAPLTVNSPDSSTQTQAVASSTDPASSFSWTPGMDFESFMDMARTFSPGVAPLLTVNMGSGTPQEAAAWVHYANIARGYRIRYWQIGNEMEGAWEWGGPLNTRDYVRRYIDFSQAMKAADPSIVITGPVASNPASPSCLYDGKGVVEDFLALLDALGKAAYVEALDFHWYPTWQLRSRAVVLDTP